MNHVKIGIVDDSSFILKMLSKFFSLSTDPYFEIVFELNSCDRFMGQGQFSIKPQVMFLDVDMPGLKGVDAIPQLLQCFPNCRIIMFTATENKSVLIKCIAQGASGYLTKDAGGKEMLHAIKTTLNEKIYISSALTIPVRNYLQCERVRFMPFTKLEQDVLTGLQEGEKFANNIAALNGP